MQRGFFAIAFPLFVAGLLAVPVTLPGAPACAWAQAAATETGFSVDGIGLDASRETVLPVFKEKYQIVREYIDHLSGVGLLMGAPGKPEDYESPQRIAGFSAGKLFVYAFINEYDLAPELYAKWVADFTSRFGDGSATPPEFLTSSALWEDMRSIFESESSRTTFWAIPETKHVLFAVFDEDGGEGGYFLINVPEMDRNYDLFIEMTNNLS